MILSLNGTWKVNHIPYNHPISDILEESFIPEGWLEAKIPEEIHSTLRKAGYIRGHVYSKDTEEERWIEEADWVYYKEFYMPDTMKAKEVMIDFQGLDTFCDIFLNGVKIGTGNNMHLPVQVDVTGTLQYGKRNVLAVRFYSPVKHVEHMDQKGIFSITTSDRILARKAQMNYSWDFCGRCVTTGIWKDVTICAQEDAVIGSYYLYTKSITEGEAVLGLTAELDGLEGCGAEYTLMACLTRSSVADNAGRENTEYTVTACSIEGSGMSVQEEEAAGKKFFHTVFSKEGRLEEFKSLDIRVADPVLWWPRPYGSPELYDFRLILKKNGTVIDEKHQRFGIRTIEIIQEDQGDGRSFLFAVNGRRLFIRGANWVPLNVVYTDITDEDYEDLIDYAVQGNLSMLRIWGGGIYESPRLFELCDEKGIMLWNDFMLSCGIYPQNEEFLGNVAREAEYVIQRYRNYTSLVIWAGDNENGQAYGWAGRPYEFQEDRISNVILKEACGRLDLHRPYLPTSPCSPDEFYKGGDNPESPYQGDMHLYIMSADPGVREYRDYGKNYYKRVRGFRPRFMSEFGFICFPEKDTYYKYNFLREPIRDRKELMEFLPFAGEYLEKAEHDKAIYYSQVYNSMALKYWIEYFRSLKWTCGGSLYWKFNDPVADPPKGGIFPSHMSTVDMFRRTKMTYYYTRRAYEDLVVVCRESDRGYEVYSCSELTEDIDGWLVVTHRDFQGNIYFTKELRCKAGKDSSALLCKIASEELAVADARNEYLKIEFQTEDNLFENRYLFTDIYEINQLKLTPSGLRITGAWRKNTLITLRLRTEAYACNVRVNLLDKRADYSDNYFEMDAGSEKEITISLRDTLGIESMALYIEGENVDRIILSLAELQA
ncbi:beta-mannosidase [Anaerotaenia torta]|uniref:glycoside hydrolase family 2 protein n=1 Tax=Anaerotaenia torta TaxID=433293 RepID=UPI003D254C90